MRESRTSGSAGGPGRRAVGGRRGLPARSSAWALTGSESNARLTSSELPGSTSCGTIRSVRRPFISYAREDYDTAVRLHDDLRRAGAIPWLDRKTIRAGEDWRQAIREGLKSATHVIALISQHSVNKRGFVQNELRQALELLEETPPGQIFIIPVRPDASEPHHARLNDLHRVDLFNNYEEGLERILESLRATSRSNITPITQPSVDRVAAMIAHEMNNVMGIIRPYLGIIMREAGHLERVSRSVEVMERAITRGHILLSDVLSITRPRPVVRQRVSVRDWLGMIEPELRAMAGDHATLEIRDVHANLVITADPNALTQVLTNLVANAAQAIEDTGEIVVAAEVGTMQATGTRAVCLSVADTGSGIEPAYMERIFEPFFTTKQHGSGVGLALTQSIVAAHAGELTLQSTLGKGTTFFLYLPVPT